MKRLIWILLAFSLLAGMLTGCGTEDAPYTPTGAGLTWDEDYTGPVNKPQDEETEQKLELTYYPDRSMNPYTCTDFTNRALFSLLYQGLFTVDRNYDIQPQLCKNYRVSEDMKTYTFYLDNATFTDGTALTAMDVMVSLQTARDNSYYGGRFTHITDMELSGDGGITVKTKVPMENLPLLLDIPIVKQTEVILNAPLGTGPYYLDAANSVLRKNTNWWCKKELVVSAPAIMLRTAKSESGIRDSFEFDGVNLVCADPGSDKYADYRCDYELWDCENGIFLYLACNMESPVFMDNSVRAALSSAIDRDTLAADYYRGFARSASLPASPQSPYYSHNLAAKYAYDGGEKLTQAVTDASKSSSEIILLVNKDDSLRLRVARDIAKMLTACGLKVTMSEKSTSGYNSALKRKEFDLYLGQTKLSPNMDLSNFFSNKGALTYGGISDVALYALCTEALANRGNYYTLHKNVMDDGRLCPILVRSYSVYATRGLLTGLTPSRDSVFYYSMERTMENALIKN